MVMPDSWEFARHQGRGELMMVLSDDDAMLPDTLERFLRAKERYDADFLFSNMAEYRDHAFPPADSNTLAVPAYSGWVRVIDRAAYVNQLMAFNQKYNAHPSCYVFESALANTIADRNNGRFFQTLGAEYFAWPVAAVLARKIVYIDAPLVVVGRTSKSWGTNMVLMNPGQEKIEQLVSDAQTERRYTPLTNFTFNNLAIEGLLTAAATFPEELLPLTRSTSAAMSGRREPSSNVERNRRSMWLRRSRSSMRTSPHIPNCPQPRHAMRQAESGNSPPSPLGGSAVIASSHKPSTPVKSTTSPTRSAPRSSSQQGAADRSRPERPGLRLLRRRDRTLLRSVIGCRSTGRASRSSCRCCGSMSDRSRATRSAYRRGRVDSRPRSAHASAGVQNTNGRCSCCPRRS